MNSPPSSLGQYQIIREIARSNDIVYEAYDPLMNRRVAIKELAMPQGASSQQQEERINRFKREAQAAGTLNHPNIMTVFSFAEDAGRTFMAMEYLDGCTLRNEIDTKGVLPVDRAVEIIVQVLEGLSHAHSKGVIHRDIKPDNIQILSNGTIKITDFGIARLTFQPNLTMDGQVFGTPSYMSPEQVVGRDIDARSDLFSVGVVLYEMISGQKPFGGDSVVSITYAIMNAEPPHLSQANHAMWQVLARSLDKSPQLRYASADEMIQAVRDAVRSGNSGVMGAVPAAPATGSYGINPYMTPAPTPVAAPPPIYAYNPYQAGPAPSPYQTTPYQANPYQASPYQPTAYQAPSQYQAGQSMAPPAAVPIYYPPPPRQPLLSPETSSFIKRVISVFVVVGTLLLLLLVGINALVSGISNARKDSHDQAIPAYLEELPANMPVDERIQKFQDELRKDHSVGVKADLKHRIAMLCEQAGNEAIGRADSPRAEYYFGQGLDIDPTNAALWSDKAHLLETQLNSQQDAASRVQLVMEIGNDWEKAARYEPVQSRRSQFAREAAYMYLNYADAVIQSTDRTAFKGARDLLYGIRELTTNDADVQGRIKDALSKLS